MPELPEVEYAARIARAACRGKTLVSVRALHRSQLRLLGAAVARSLVGDVVSDVVRRGKHQLFLLGSGRIMHVHFRMTGDWRLGRSGEVPGRVTRVVFDFSDGTQLALDDSRALSTVVVHDAGVEPLPELGPEATADAFSAEWLADRLAGRRTPIKPALLDQRLVAGIGNIHASEALWYARVDPATLARDLTPEALHALAIGVKRSMRKALARPERYYGANGVSDAVRFNVYDREGKRCRRCRAPIVRLTQAGRSTYFCPDCQRLP